jgi:dUTP pyrophosphatase
MSIKIIMLDHTLDQPKHGSAQSAGLDLRAASDLVLEPGQIGTVGLGVAVELPEGHVGLLLPRSGGKSFVLTNTVGVLDADYQGQIMAKVQNVGRSTLLIQKNDRIVQLVVLPCVIPSSVEYVESFESATDRGTGGFHSTGVN